MNILKDLVPLVAFWKPTGVEERVTEIEVVKITDFGISARIKEAWGLRFFHSDKYTSIKVGDKFPTGKIVELRKHYYASAEDYHNNILTPGTETIIRIIPD